MCHVPRLRIFSISFGNDHFSPLLISVIFPMHLPCCATRGPLNWETTDIWRMALWNKQFYENRGHTHVMECSPRHFGPLGIHLDKKSYSNSSVRRLELCGVNGAEKKWHPHHWCWDAWRRFRPIAARFLNHFLLVQTHKHEAHSDDQWCWSSRHTQIFTNCTVSCTLNIHAITCRWRYCSNIFIWQTRLEPCT